VSYFIVHGKGEAYDFSIVKGHWSVIYSVFETVVDGPFETEELAQVKLNELYDELATEDQVMRDLWDYDSSDYAFR